MTSGHHGVLRLLRANLGEQLRRPRRNLLLVERVLALAVCAHCRRAQLDRDETGLQRRKRLLTLGIVLQVREPVVLARWSDATVLHGSGHQTLALRPAMLCHEVT